MEYSLSNSLVGGGGGLNLDKLSLDLPFARTKSLTAAKGPTPDFVRASSGTYFGSDGYLKTAGNNVARFDHETSYIGSTVLAQCIDCANVYNTIFSAAERIPLSGIDGNGYPYFYGSLFTIAYDFANTRWLVSYDAGNWEAYSTTGLSDSYIPLTNPTIGSNLITAELACKGLLIEEQSSNLLAYSDQFNNASGWNQTPFATTTANVIVSPAGSASADRLNATNVQYGGILRVSSGNVPAYVGSTTYTMSVYAKAGTTSTIGLAITSGSATIGGLNYTYFSLVGAGTATMVTAQSGTNVSASCTNVGNGWYKCVLTYTTGVSTLNPVVTDIAITNSTGSINYTPVGTENVYLWGAQIEAKAFPTSYIPTTTGGAPRSADICSITGSAFSGFYNQPAGTVVANIYSCNGIQPRFNSFGPSRTLELLKFNGIVYHNGTNETTITSTPTFPCKVGVTCTLNDSIGVFNGVLGGSRTLLTMPSPTYMNIGCYLDNALQLNGCISSIKYYKKRLPNAKLQSLTAP